MEFSGPGDCVLFSCFLGTKKFAFSRKKCEKRRNSSESYENAIFATSRELHFSQGGRFRRGMKSPPKWRRGGPKIAPQAPEPEVLRAWVDFWGRSCAIGSLREVFLIPPPFKAAQERPQNRPRFEKTGGFRDFGRFLGSSLRRRRRILKEGRGPLLKWRSIDTKTSTLRRSEPFMTQI